MSVCASVRARLCVCACMGVCVHGCRWEGGTCADSLHPLTLLPRPHRSCSLRPVQIYEMMLGRGSGSALSREDFEASIEEYFTVTLSNGHVVELCPGGADRRVTYDNRREYVRLAVHRRLHESEIQVRHLWWMWMWMCCVCVCVHECVDSASAVETQHTSCTKNVFTTN